MWELDYKSWVPKNWCFWIVVLEKTLESPLDCKEIQPVHPKGDQSWVFIRRTDAEAETPKLWPPDAKSWLIWKDPDAGKDWGQEEKGMTEDEMAGWHHQLNGHGFGWPQGGGDGQGGLVCCSSWGRKELNTTERLNWTELLSHGQLFATPWTVACQPPPSRAFLGKNTGVGCHFLLQGIFSTQESTHVFCPSGQILYCWATREAITKNYLAPNV